jgi:APA family basic amino acid/polyamine antiporter
LAVLSPATLAGSKLAADAAAGVVFGPRGETVLGVVVIASLLSAVNANVLSAPRVLATLSRDGLLTSRLGRINSQGTPTVALAVSTLVACAFVLTRALEQLVAVLSFFFVLNYAIAIGSVFVLRVREPDAERPYRAWGHPWTTGIALVGSAAFLAGAVEADLLAKTTYSIQALVLLAICFPIVAASIKLADRRAAAPNRGANPPECDAS